MHGYEWTFYLSLQKGLGPKAPLAHGSNSRAFFVSNSTAETGCSLRETIPLLPIADTVTISIILADHLGGHQIACK